MKTIKISYYELLDKINNGEYPKIKYQDEIFKWDGYDYVNEEDELKDLIFTSNWFEPLLEILYEDEFEDIYLLCDNSEQYNFSDRPSNNMDKEDRRLLDSNFKELLTVINQLIKNQKKIIERLKEE